jgi:hypothetical protein
MGGVPEVDFDQLAALRRLRAAFGPIEILEVIDHRLPFSHPFRTDGAARPGKGRMAWRSTVDTDKDEANRRTAGMRIHGRTERYTSDDGSQYLRRRGMPPMEIQPYSADEARTMDFLKPPVLLVGLVPTVLFAFLELMYKGFHDEAIAKSRYVETQIHRIAVERSSLDPDYRFGVGG